MVTFVFLPRTLKVSAYVSVSALLLVAIGLALSRYNPNWPNWPNWPNRPNRPNR